MVNEPETPQGDGDNDEVDKAIVLPAPGYSPTVAAMLAAQPLSPLRKAVITFPEDEVKTVVT